MALVPVHSSVLILIVRNQIGPDFSFALRCPKKPMCPLARRRSGCVAPSQPFSSSRFVRSVITVPLSVTRMPLKSSLKSPPSS